MRMAATRASGGTDSSMSKLSPAQRTPRRPGWRRPPLRTRTEDPVGRRIRIATLALVLLAASLAMVVRDAHSAVSAAAEPPAGYWMVASDGGIFSFGDAAFHGSTGGLVLRKPVAGMTVTPSGHGYWLVTSDGGVLAYGDARYFGAATGKTDAHPAVGLTASPTGLGYRVVSEDGQAFGFGDAAGTTSVHTNLPIVGAATLPASLTGGVSGTGGGVAASPQPPASGG